MSDVFDTLVAAALQEGTLSDYMNAVKRANKSTTINKPAIKSATKSAIKGAAQIPGRAIQAAGAGMKGLGALTKGVGSVYSALGGKQGGAALQNIGGKVSATGGAVASAGQKVAAAPGRIHSAISQYGKGYGADQERQDFLKKYKEGIFDKFKGMPSSVKSAIDNAKSYDDVNTAIKDGMPGVSDKALSQIASTIYSGTPAAAAPSTTTPPPIPTAAVSQQAQPSFIPKLKANRSMVKDMQSNIVYKYLGKKQGGWYEYDPKTKLVSPSAVNLKDQKRITNLWRKKEISNKAKKLTQQTP